MRLLALRAFCLPQHWTKRTYSCLARYGLCPPSPPRHLSITTGYRHSPSSDNHGLCGLSHIMADFRQIMWRKFLRSLCKDNTMEQPVLPHNVAWPFSAFLPSWCRHLSAAKICGGKRIMTLNLASILRKMVLPDNVALSVFSHIFLRTDTQSCRKHVFGRSRHIMWQNWQVRAGGTVTFAGVFT
jgi:hypothetical protein